MVYHRVYFSEAKYEKTMNTCPLFFNSEEQGQAHGNHESNDDI